MKTNTHAETAAQDGRLLARRHGRSMSAATSSMSERMSVGEASQAVASVVSELGHKITFIPRPRCRLLKENRHE